MEGPGADSEEKRVLASDLDTVMVDSLKALDLSRPIREADIKVANRRNEAGSTYGSRASRENPLAGIAGARSKFRTSGGGSPFSK